MGKIRWLGLYDISSTFLKHHLVALDLSANPSTPQTLNFRVNSDSKMPGNSKLEFRRSRLSQFLIFFWFFWTVNYQFHKVTVIESLLTMSYSGTIIVIWKIESVQIDGSYIHQKFFLHLTHFRVKFWWPPGWGQFYEKSYLGSPEHGFGKCWSFQLRSILSN